MSFFARTEPKFLLPAENGDIEILPFLAAARQVPPFMDLMGRTFRPIKSDMEGNINKLQKVLDKNQSRNFKTFTEMIIADKENGTSKRDDSATIALLWLKRGFTYIVLMLEQLVQDHKNGSKIENIVPFCTKAYEESLKMYHRWLFQKMFSVLMRACPYRNDLFRSMAAGHPCSDDEVVQDVEEFLSVMRPLVDRITAMYQEQGVDFDDKV